MRNRLFLLFFIFIITLIGLIIYWPYIFPNHELATSNSTYLNQHKNDYVKWQIWGEDVLLSAKKDNKLLFISAGFATCYWCHYMQKDSFQDFFLAKYLNDYYYSILIDKEVDVTINRLYMQALTFEKGYGGWPMTIIALPDGTPIFLGITLQRDELLKKLKYYHEFWLEKPEKLQEMATDWLKKYSSDLLVKSIAKNTDYLQDLRSSILENIDPIMGGFKGQPKFPNSYRWLALIDLDELQIIHMKRMVDQILESPIFDIVDGGIHRYSSDKMWTIPHFEKLLVDQIYFVQMLIKLHKAYNDSNYLTFANITIEFIHDFLQSSDGLFITGLDAGGINEEGDYYYFDTNIIEQHENGLNFIRFKENNGLIALKSLININDVNRHAFKDYRKKNKHIPDKDYYINLAVNAQLLATLIDYRLISDSNLYDPMIQSLISYFVNIDVNELSLHQLLVIYDSLNAIDSIRLTNLISSIEAKLTKEFPYFNTIDYLPRQFVKESFEDDYNGPQTLYFLLKHNDLFLDSFNVDLICNELKSIINDPWEQISIVKYFNNNCI